MLEDKRYNSPTVPISYKEGNHPIPNLKAAFIDCQTCGESSFYLEGNTSFAVAESGANLHIRTKKRVEEEDRTEPGPAPEHEVVLYQFAIGAPFPDDLIKPDTHIYGFL